jgi:DUF438 domain-containing protein
LQYNRQISRRLHEEHTATLSLWGRVEQTVLSGTNDRALLREADAALADELTRHFEFEEKELFPRLEGAGEGDIAGLLQEEHHAIRQSADQFHQLYENPSAPRFRAAALALAEQLVAHVQKEEMALLPMLDDLLDEPTDSELLLVYAEA